MSEPSRSRVSQEKSDFLLDEDSSNDLDNFAEDESVFSDDSDVHSTPVSRKRRKRWGKKRTVPLSDEEAEKKRVLANSQERDRMNRLNKALNNLRKALPAEYTLYNRRLSKIRTLRLAVSYIKGLSEMLQQDYLPPETHPAMMQQQQQQQQSFYPGYPQQQFLSPAFMSSPHFSGHTTPGDEGYFSFSDSRGQDSSFLGPACVTPGMTFTPCGTVTSGVSPADEGRGGGVPNFLSSSPFMSPPSHPGLQWMSSTPAGSTFPDHFPPGMACTGHNFLGKPGDVRASVFQYRHHDNEGTVSPYTSQFHGVHTAGVTSTPVTPAATWPPYLLSPAHDAIVSGLPEDAI